MRSRSRFYLQCAAGFVAALVPVALCAQDPVVTLPKNYQLAFENADVRVVRVTYGPHEKLAVHDHSKAPVIYVYLSDSGPVRFIHYGAKENGNIATRQPLKAGTYRINPGRLEQHAVENAGDIESRFLRVELKRAELGFKTSDSMAVKHPDLTQVGLLNEFNSLLFRVDRVLADRKPVQVNGEEPSLLIAYTPALIQLAGAGAAESLNAGELRWMEAGHRFDVRSPGTANAHVLRVVFTRR